MKVYGVVVHRTDGSEEAERWRAELSAGRLPQSTENGLSERSAIRHAVIEPRRRRPITVAS